MSAEIQTGLFILTAELAGVTTLAALAAGIVAWSHRKGRLKAAEALRAAAERLPGEGEIVRKEKALLGEFARAYLTRDADLLAALPKALLALRQMHEDIQVSEDAADTQQAEAMQAEREALQARTEALEKQQAHTAQQLEGTLSTINTLVREYGRGRGQEVTPTAEALLQALLSMQGAPARAHDLDDAEIPLPDVDATPPKNNGAGQADEAGVDQGEGGMDLMFADTPEPEPGPEPGPESGPVAEAVPEAKDEPAPAPTLSSEDVDALLMGVLAERPAPEKRPEPEPEPEPEPAAEAPAAPAPRAAEPSRDAAMDLSTPVEKPKDKAPAPAHDDLDDLDIDALLDAEMGRQAKLLTPAPASVDDLDLSRTDTSPSR